MSKSTLTWYKSKAKRIVKDLRLVKQKTIATTINLDQSTISRQINGSWQKELEKWLRLLDLAGYEVIEKEVI